MKPIVIVKKGTMSAQDIQRLNDNGLCVVESEEPALIKFLDPIPSAAERTKIEEACIMLSRKLLGDRIYNNGSTFGRSLSRADITKLYVGLLTKGTRLDEDGTQEEQDAALFAREKHEELCRLARQEAKEERARKKAAAAAAKPAAPAGGKKP